MAKRRNLLEQQVKIIETLHLWCKEGGMLPQRLSCGAYGGGLCVLCQRGWQNARANQCGETFLAAKRGDPPLQNKGDDKP